MKQHLPIFFQKLSPKKILSLIGIFIVSGGFSQVVDTIPESHSNPNGFGSDARANYTYSTGDVITYLNTTIDEGGLYTFNPTTVTTSTTAACLPAKRRIQANSFELEMKSSTASKFVIGLGTSSSTGTIRVLRGIFVNGTLLDPGTYQTSHNWPSEGVTQSTCAEVTIEGLSIAKNAKVTMVFGSSPTSTPQNIRLSYINIFPDLSLPVRLLSFDAVNRSNGVEVLWKASNEAEGKSYSIERSNNGLNFEEIKKVETLGAGSYSYLDKTAKLGPVVYYRLQMVSADGKVDYSKIKAVSINGSRTLMISPNPVKGNSLNATFNPFTESTTVKILNTSGMVLSTQKISPFTNQTSINTSGLQKGVYIIQFINSNEVKTTRFVKD